jgi:hypothetical protein
MIKINVTKRKIVEFDVNVRGVDPNALSGRLSLFYENVIYSFPAVVEDGNVVRVEIPALDEVIKSDIPDKYQATIKLEMVGADTFMQPWGGSAILEHPIKVEAVMKSGGERLEEEEAPKVKATLKLLKEEPKYDISTLASGTSNKKSGDEEKELEKLKKKKKKEEKEKSKLAQKLDGEEEEEKKKESTEEASKLGEELAKALLGEQEFQSDKIGKKISKDEWKKQFVGQLEMIKPKVAEKLKKKNIIGFMTKAMQNGLSPGQAVDKAK